MAYYKENEFGAWLTVNYPSSASSYKSGVGGLITWINSNKHLWKKPVSSTKVKDFEDYLKETNKMSERETLFSAVLNILQKDIQKAKKGKGSSTPISTLQNFKSYLCAYEEFFKSQPFVPKAGGFKANHLALLRKNSTNATYTRDELINEFSNRILTQDRISMAKEILFPIRLIRKLWKHDTELWAKKVCNNIWLILKSNTNPYVICQKQIKDIDTLCIKRSGEVIVSIGKNIFTLCTSYSDPYESIVVDGNDIKFVRKRSNVTNLCCPIPSSGKFFFDKNQNVIDPVTNKIILWHIKPAIIKSLGDIAIDHDIPISLVLNEKKKKLTVLKIISNLYRDISANYNLSVAAANANKFCSKLTSGDKKTILSSGYPRSDMDEIGKCKLVLMGKEENSLKSDS